MRLHTTISTLAPLALAAVGFASTSVTESTDIAIPTKDGVLKWGYEPEGEGHHGSRALWSEREGYRAVWTAVTGFLVPLR